MDKGIHSIVLVHENSHYFCAQSETTSGDMMFCIFGGFAGLL